MKAATFMQPMNFLYPHSMHVRILKKLDDGDHRTNQYAGLQDEQTGHFPAYRLYVRFRRKMLQLALYPPDSGFDRVSGHGCTFSTSTVFSTEDSPPSGAGDRR